MNKAQRAAEARGMGDEEENTAKERAVAGLREVLNGNEWGTLENALRVAARQFTEDARAFRKTLKEVEASGEPPRGMTAPACRRLAEQFERQTKETEALLNLFEGR